MVKDPVCGMNVDEKTATLKSEYDGKTYYFCNQSSRKYSKKTRKDLLTKIPRTRARAIIVAVAGNPQKTSVVNN